MIFNKFVFDIFSFIYVKINTTIVVIVKPLRKVIQDTFETTNSHNTITYGKLIHVRNEQN